MTHYFAQLRVAAKRVNYVRMPFTLSLQAGLFVLATLRSIFVELTMKYSGIDFRDIVSQKDIRIILSI
jgi:hypothetical protein